MLEVARELASAVGVAAACTALAVPRSSFYEAQQPARPAPAPRPRPRSHRALRPEEEQTIRDLLNSERFVDQAPRTIYATLLDEGHHYCSWRTMYRILTQDAATRERGCRFLGSLISAPQRGGCAPTRRRGRRCAR